MACERNKKDLMAAALGGVPANRRAELNAHLAECAACRAEFERQRELLAAIDRGVAASVAAEPSADLAARIREHLREQPAPAASWLSGWIPAAAGAMAVFVIVAVWLARRPQVAPGNPAPVIAQVPPTVQPAPPAPSPAETSTPAKMFAAVARPAPHRVIQSHRQVVRGAAARDSMPEVLVPRGQEVAVMRLYALLQRDRGLAASLAADEKPDSIVPPELKIAPLVVAPLENPDVGAAPDATGYGEKN